MVLCSTCTVRVLFLAKLWIGHFLAKLCAIGIIAEHSTEKWFKMMNFCRKIFFSGGFAKRSTRTVHLCNGGMLRAAAEKTFVRNRLRITDEFKHLKKSLFVHYLYRTSAAAQKTPYGVMGSNPISKWIIWCMQHLKKSLFVSIFVTDEVCVFSTLFVQNIGRGPENSFNMESWVRIPLIIAANNGGLVCFLRFVSVFSLLWSLVMLVMLVMLVVLSILVIPLVIAVSSNCVPVTISPDDVVRLTWAMVSNMKCPRELGVNW